MKQLLVKILFIFGSALIYVQCVKVFIAGDKISSPQSAISRDIHPNKHNTKAAIIINAVSMNTGFKIQGLFYNMISKINSTPIFYNPGNNFINYCAVGKYLEK